MENLRTHDSVNAESYGKSRYKKFCDDMEQSGLDVILDFVNNQINI